ncbi:hypothetical protein CUJ83_08640 [Methanocella sp. CWC-04]|uniref:Uncharacterized protein n=1 Tax=Methanooceanicella nereidis TaxID=2052831 RepID=A0AAP2W674_9EURY|nr:hypothetical protein [Methanocella sp. CWC-04]MCD1295063.1 hypothetical protein [Methanocella sp. CWC-04]
MDRRSTESLQGKGGSADKGSLIKNGLVVILVIVVLVMCAGVYVLYDETGKKNADLKQKQDDYDALNAAYLDIESKYTSLTASYSELNESHIKITNDYEDLLSEYGTLQNKTSVVDNKVNAFLENGVLITYTYSISASSTNNSSVKTLTVTAFNIGKETAGSVEVLCKVDDSGAMDTHRRTFQNVGSMDKVTAQWMFDNSVKILEVWAGPEVVF